ncbi:MFS transporter [Rhodococcus sp. X156]|uniref:MFS transporter n=1 Tax=Rhodococcus sp. X156 TaxID=2499145 RepID=UPI000FD8DE78|nr:MFS transporter [Rhodococcus sp. X156]
MGARQEADGARSATSPPTFGDVLRVREFRWLWFADIQSMFGDQLARVALSVLVFSETGSGILTAGVYALTYLPALLGSILLGTLADRLPVRRLLVGGDLLRAGLLALMALPSMPLAVVAALLVVSVLVGTPWRAAETALVAEVLDGEGFVLGTSLRIATTQGSQLLGFAVGGAAVAAVGAHTTLAVNAATFVVSAVLIRLHVRARPAARHGVPTGSHGWVDGLTLVFRTRRLRSLVGLAWLAGVFVVPEGLAAPYADSLGGGARTVGLLLAAGPAGVLLGSLLFVRLLPHRLRTALVGPLAVAAGVPLLFCGLQPGLEVTLLLWAVSGLCSAYQVQIVVEYVLAVPRPQRGQAIGIASAGLLAAQGVGLLVGGLAAELWNVSVAVAAAGALGVALAAPLALRRARSTDVVAEVPVASPPRGPAVTEQPG